MSHPTWVRGLKLPCVAVAVQSVGVAPYVGAWIETNALCFAFGIHPKSHPTWVRGLKLWRHYICYNKAASHPTWVRGLKPRRAQMQRP